MDPGTAGCLRVLGIIAVVLFTIGFCISQQVSNTTNTNNPNAPAWVHSENRLITAGTSAEDAISAAFNTVEFRFEWQEAETGKHHSTTVQLNKVEPVNVPDNSSEAMTVQFEWTDGGQVVKKGWTEDPSALVHSYAAEIVVRLTTSQKQNVPGLAGR